MKIAPLADVKARLSAYLEQAETEGPVVITRNGKAVAVLLAPYDDDDLENILIARSPRFQAVLDKSRQSIKAGKGLPEKNFWKTVSQRGRKTKDSRPTAKRAT
jgi:prevent-host-death family protein